MPRRGLLAGIHQAYSSEVSQLNEVVGEGQVDYAEVCAPENGEILKYVLEKGGTGVAVGSRKGDDLTRSPSLEKLLEKLRLCRPRHVLLHLPPDRDHSLETTETTAQRTRDLRLSRAFKKIVQECLWFDWNCDVYVLGRSEHRWWTTTGLRVVMVQLYSRTFDECSVSRSGLQRRVRWRLVSSEAQVMNLRTSCQHDH